MGKGCKRRPYLINKELADLNWDIAFCKDPEKKAKLADKRAALYEELKASAKLYER